MKKSEFIRNNSKIKRKLLHFDIFTEPTGKEGIFMRYSYGFKRNAVELYREGLWPGTPKGVKEYNFRKMVRSWVRLEEAK